MSTGNSIRLPAGVKDIAGKPFNKLTAVSYAGTNLGSQTGAYWHFRCECGTEKVISAGAVRSGSIRSCGCTRNAANRMSSSSEYRVWHDMKRRCYDTKRRDYKYYGGRSIIVCERWRSSFVNFFSDMGPKPFPGATIERIDNDGNYEKSNCKWATQEEQKKNTRNVRKLTYNGETMSIGDWARKLGINRCTLRLRLDKGWPLEEVFSSETSFIARKFR